MLTTLVVLATLAADPADTASSASAASTDKAAATTAAAPSPALELLIPEKMIEDFLTAASPYDRTITRDVEMLGFAQKVQIDLKLSHPKVRVTPKGVIVTMDYELRGPGGITSRGRATPRMELRALPDKNQIEGKLTGAKLSATGGIDIPVDDLMDPVRFPAGATGPLDVGGKKVIAEGHAREVVLEDGVVRVKGDWSFKKPDATDKSAEKTAATTAP